MMALNEVADEEVDRFKDYVITTRVDDIVARLPIELWLKHDNIAKIRTNNHLKEWHSKLNHAINRPHAQHLCTDRTSQGRTAQAITKSSNEITFSISISKFWPQSTPFHSCTEQASATIERCTVCSTSSSSSQYWEAFVPSQQLGEWSNWPL